MILANKALEMGPTEFKLLHFFMSHPERAYSRAQVLDRVWGANVYVEERTVDVHIRRLRKALQAGDPLYADLIQTVTRNGLSFLASRSGGGVIERNFFLLESRRFLLSLAGGCLLALYAGLDASLL